MTESTPSPQPAPTTPPNEIDKDALYGEFTSFMRKRLTWQNDLAKSMTHKALDIPEEDPMNINVRNIHNHAAPAPATVAAPGLSTLAKLAIGGGLLATGAGGGIGLPLLIDGVKSMFTQPANQPMSPVPPVTVQPVPTQPADWDIKATMRVLD